MTDEAEARLGNVWALEEERLAPRPPSPAGAILAAAAIAVSAGLAWWAAHPARAPAPPPVSAPAAAPPRPLQYADAEPDPGQVRAAWREAQASFTQGGAQALAERSVSCAKALAAQPGRLDFCLAFDAYAAEIVAGAPGAGAAADWFAAAPDRDLALARSALPQEVDAANRLAQVQALTTAVLPKPEPKPAASEAPRPHRPAAHQADRDARHKPAPARRRAHAARPHPRPPAEKAAAANAPAEPAAAFDGELPPF
jgi:hypothetical protein